ncbi:hypothetical protein M011DRAFT_495720 [Sporormia fimetaria CBS 119925]|uniref:Uncharacterized protein n=1 Tax=Sporormia fimetaria CBS 119925 TaxID=1340428 RepID=A0A6A6V3W9_9PLEO|nr:hypothetical protein M011DRAFT_495720 [Sporormia fimetaria CBS 119925]
MSRLSRLHDSPASSYSDRVPQQNHLYDWSPENEAEGDDELDLLLADLRSSRSSPLDPLPALSQSQLEREARMPSPSRLLTANPDNSLRSTAILQAARRHPRFASISLPQSDRDPVTTSPHRSREPSSTHNTRQQIMQRITDQRARERERERENRERLSRAESFRRGYLEGSSRSASSPILGRTIQYLADLRGIGKVDAPSGLPADVTMMDHVHAKSTFSDYVLDTASLPPPAPSSWLLPGAVLSGFQHATAVVSALRNLPGGASTTYRFRNGDSMSSTMFDTTRPWPNPESSLSPFRGPLRNQSPETVVSFAPDRWPVKVTIHAVDYESMSLCATMEAYNVPSHPQLDLTQSILNSTNAVPSSSSLFTRTSSITTYLEGEIIDFDKHTLLTESFKSDPDNDATYWAKLPCFSDYSDQELVKNLTSKRWIKEVLMAEWILMRWKERCFVKPLSHSENRRGDTVVSAFDDSSCGLTISGFYYTCLRRSDGKLDGLYYDPQSTPYQCLQLESVRGVFPAWDFR